MDHTNGFVFKKGVLIQYTGTSEHVIVPQEVTEIDITFWGWEGMRKLVIPDSVERVHPLFQMVEPPEHFDIVAPIAVLETIWSNFSLPYKTQECVGYLDGTFDRRDGFARVIRAYIKKNKKKFFNLICDRDSAAMMEKFLDCLQKVTLDQLDAYLVAAQCCVNLMAYLLNYKQENFSGSQIQEAAQESAEKELGIREKNVADWRKVFRFVISDGCVEIKGYKGTEPVVVVPERIGKNPVTRIDERAFLERVDLTGILLPESITYIGRQAFACCTGLTEFVIPEGVVVLKNGAFAGCTGITAIKIPSTITEICSTTFFACEKLTSAYIPATVTKICETAFRHCPDVTIHAPAGSYAETYAKENNIPFTAE